MLFDIHRNNFINSNKKNINQLKKYESKYISFNKINKISDEECKYLNSDYKSICKKTVLC